MTTKEVLDIVVLAILASGLMFILLNFGIEARRNIKELEEYDEDHTL